MDKAEYLSKLNRTPTTLEMDGIFTKEDELNRFKIWYQCKLCANWTLVDMKDNPDKECNNCGESAFDVQSATSMRTFDPIKAKKRKPPKKK